MYNPFAPMDENHPFYYTDLIDISKERDINKARQRIRTIMKGSNKCKPFSEQNSEVLVIWLSSIRMNAAQRIDPLIIMLIEEGFVEHLFRLLTHSYRSNKKALEQKDGPLIDCFDNRAKFDPQEGDYDFYPAYAAEILFSIILHDPNHIVKQVYENYFVRNDETQMNRGLKILAKALKFGLTTTKYFCLQMINILLVKTPLGADGTFINDSLNEGILDVLLDVLNLPYDTTRKELESNRGGHQVDIIRPMSDTETMIEYSPRYVSMIREVCSHSLLLALACNADRREILLRKPGLLTKVLSSLDEIITDYYPESDQFSNICLFLMMLSHIPNHRYDEQWMDLLRLIDTDDHIDQIIQTLFNIRTIDNLHKYCSKKAVACRKYHPEIPPNMEEIAEGIEKIYFAELALFDVLANLSEVKEIAQKIYDFNEGWIVIAAQNVLFDSLEHDKLREIMEMQTKRKLINIKDFRPLPSFTHPFNQNLVGRISFSFNGCAAVLLRNMHKHGLHHISDITKLDSMLQQAIDEAKQRATELVKTREFDLAIYMYSNCLRMLNLRYNPDDTMKVILFSNRSEMHLQKKQFQWAREDALSALEIDPTHQKSQSRLARANQGLASAK